MAERLKARLLDQQKLADLVAGPDAYRDLPRIIAAVQVSCCFWGITGGGGWSCSWQLVGFALMVMYKPQPAVTGVASLTHTGTCHVS